MRVYLNEDRTIAIYEDRRTGELSVATRQARTYAWSQPVPMTLQPKYPHLEAVGHDRA